MSKNRKYTKEFKDSTIQLVMKGEQSVLKIGADLGVNPKTIYNWVREYKKANNIITPTRGYTTINTQKNITKETVEEENKRLRAENKLLKQERDILKKATAYFAKETL
jgi:transposase